MLKTTPTTLKPIILIDLYSNSPIPCFIISDCIYFFYLLPLKARMETHQNNIEKMTAFIFHEAREKAEEIRIKAYEEYNLEKAKIVKIESEKVESIFQHKLKEADIDLKRSVGLAKAEGKMCYMRKVSEIVSTIFLKVNEIIVNIKTDQELVDQALNNIYEDNIIVYCNDNVNIPKTRKIKYEIRCLNKKLIGGIVVESIDGKTRVDNSYKARIESFKAMHLDLIANRLFKNL